VKQTKRIEEIPGIESALNHLHEGRNRHIERKMKTERGMPGQMGPDEPPPFKFTMDENRYKSAFSSESKVSSRGKVDFSSSQRISKSDFKSTELVSKSQQRQSHSA